MRRRELIESQAKKLDKALMVRYDPRTEYLNSTGESAAAEQLCGGWNQVVLNPSQCVSVHLP